MVSIIRRASLFLVIFVCTVRGWSFQKQNRKEEEETEQQQTYQFTQGYNILHRLQVHHLTLTFIIHNKYISTLIYIHTYIYTMNCSNNKTFYYNDTINIRYKLLGRYKEG